MRRFSPYNYCFNNPLRFTDPDGMAPSDIIVVGTKQYRQQVMRDLQKLTNEKLVFTKAGNIVFKGTPSGGKKPVGTSLVNKLIASEHKIIIKDNRDGDNHTHYVNRSAAEGKEKGGSGSTIEYNPNNFQNGKDGVKNEDGTTGRPPQVGLGHELGHAEKGIDGTAMSTDKSNPKELDANLKNGSLVIATDPDNNNERIYMDKDEIDVRKNVDNPIRREQGAKKRALPVVE